MLNPQSDDILSRFKAQAERTRGRLKIFFGAAAGVGKTYAMLQDAHARQAEGIDVLIGYVEPHGRQETEALLAGLELLPTRTIEHRGVGLQEFDLDAALARQPEMIFVDELAHTNAPGSRHPKRWQDIEELLAVGIHVTTTVNVQHLESLNDIVAQITGVIVRETFPDQLMEQADEIKFVDTPPDDLLQRLREGKIYRQEQAERAATSFFRKGNLIALRELALRRTADRVDAQMEDYRRDHAISEPWPTMVRMLVGVSAGPEGARLVRAARRMAAGLRASWVVAYVEHPARDSDAQRAQIAQTMLLAEQLGAETVLLNGTSTADELLSFARTRNISKIVIGKPATSRWYQWFRDSVFDTLLHQSGVIDIYVLSGDYGDTESEPVAAPAYAGDVANGYAWALGIVVLAALVAWLMMPYFDEANLIMMYLLGVVAVAIRSDRRGPVVAASILSVLAFDFFNVPPYLTFAVADSQYLITFAIMLLVALVISELTIRLSNQTRAARLREQRTAALYALSRALSGERQVEQILQVAVRHISQMFESRIVFLLPVSAERIQPWGTISGWWSQPAVIDLVFAPNSSEQGVAQWVFSHAEPAGLGTNTLPSSEALYLPLNAAQRSVGVLGLRPTDQIRLLATGQRELLQACADQVAQAIARVQLTNEAEQARVSAETERTRAALLAAVSHDLRTPLTVISGASETLRDATLDSATRAELTATVADEANRLNRLVTNLLEMTRIESGAIQLRRELQPLEEVIGVVLARISEETHPVQIKLAPDVPAVSIDAMLIEQVLLNLLDNAQRYTPPGTPITLHAYVEHMQLVIEVADRGPGLNMGDEQRIFEKFYRGTASDRDGSGLGLAICRSMVEAHGGTISAENRPNGGALFRIRLPL